MFLGASKVTLDDKGRVAIPARYRDRIRDRADGHLVVTASPPGPGARHLRVYMQPDWEEAARKLTRLPGMHPITLALQRRLIGYASERDMDGHGRILINPTMQEFAGIERHAMLVGQGSRLELWDDGRWKEQIDELDKEILADLPEEFMALVL